MIDWNERVHLSCISRVSKYFVEQLQQNSLKQLSITSIIEIMLQVDYKIVEPIAIPAFTCQLDMDSSLSSFDGDVYTAHDFVEIVYPENLELFD